MSQIPLTAEETADVLDQCLNILEQYVTANGLGFILVLSPEHLLDKDEKPTPIASNISKLEVVDILKQVSTQITRHVIESN